MVDPSVSSKVRSVRGLGWVLIGNVVRLGAGMGVFVVLARLLGPTDFGRFSVALAASALVCMPVNFGMGTFILRSFGTSPGSKATTLSSVLTARVWVTAALLAGTGMVWLSGLAQPWMGLVFVLLAAQALEAVTETYTNAFRASSDYAGEARAATIVAVLHVVIVLGVVGLSRTAWAGALGFLASKIAATYWMRRAARASFEPLPLLPLKSAIQTLRSSRAYGLEYMLLTSYSQFDVIVINSMLGNAAAGFYQAGMRLVQGYARVAPIVAQYILPKLARNVQSSGGAQRWSATFRVVGMFVLVGTLGAAPLILMPDWTNSLLFGAGFQGLDALLPWFGVVLILRFAETGSGLMLVASGLQGRKVWLVLAQLLALLSLGLYVLRQFGLQGWLGALMVSTLLLIAGYAALLWFHQGPHDDQEGVHA